MRLVLRRAVEKAGLKKRITPHSMRHAFATHLVELKTDIRLVQQLLGHSSPDTTYRYTRLSSQTIKSPFDLLGTKDAKVLG